MSEWFNCYELKGFMAEEVTKLQKDTDISLGQLSKEIFGDEEKLLKVFKSFDDIWRLDNELARRIVNGFEQ